MTLYQFLRNLDTNNPIIVLDINNIPIFKAINKSKIPSEIFEEKVIVFGCRTSEFDKNFSYIYVVIEK